MDTPFNKRLTIIQNLLNNPSVSKKRSLNSALHRNRCYTHQNPLKSLDLLRQIIQNSLNKEIDSVVQHYMQKFFVPAILNIRRNNFDVSDEQIHLICRRILEEAKKMYLVSIGPAKENELFDTCDDRASFPRLINKNIAGLLRGKRKETGTGESDSESDISQCSSVASSSIVKKLKRDKQVVALGKEVQQAVQLSEVPNSPMNNYVSTKNVEKWNPDRLDKDTLFVLGSKANEALGLGAQRGRIYVKHADIFRYSTDTEDHELLYDSCQKVVRFGRRAFFMVLEDIVELAKSPEYEFNPSVNMSDLIGFKISRKLLDKIKLKTLQIYRDLCLKKETSPRRKADESFPTSDFAD